jgi:hypothetical protein
MSTPLPSVGQDIEQRLKALEEMEAAKAEAFGTKAKNWVKGNWLHVVNAGGIAYSIATLKHFL